MAYSPQACGKAKSNSSKTFETFEKYRKISYDQKDILISMWNHRIPKMLSHCKSTCHVGGLTHLLKPECSSPFIMYLLCDVCLCVTAHATAYCRWQRTTCGRQFSSSTMRVLGIELWLSSLLVRIFMWGDMWSALKPNVDIAWGWY